MSQLGGGLAWCTPKAEKVSSASETFQQQVDKAVQAQSGF